MIEAQTFDIIDSVAKTLRRQENTPLGGMQVMYTIQALHRPSRAHPHRSWY